MDACLLVSIFSSVNDPHLTAAASAAPTHESIRALLRPAMAELIGSALFVFIACGAGMTTVKYQTVVSTDIQTVHTQPNKQTALQIRGVEYTFPVS